MGTVARYKGFEIAINTNDHLPPHVHVWRAGAEAKIAIVGGKIMENEGMRRADLRTARAIVKSYEGYLLRKWEEIHG